MNPAYLALALQQEADLGLIGCSEAMHQVRQRLARLAQSNATVLVTGPSGSGKELAAQALHRAGPRAAGPLVALDCAATPATLFEAELFGFERGAFTGAANRSVGALERADGGTLFLDEIGELPLELQPKLLRALESRAVRRLGSGEEIHVDVRVVAATNRDLSVEVAAGRFRANLFFRLSVVAVEMPPLAERADDVALLARHFLERMGVSWAPLLTPAALALLGRHSWPGNVRELRNVIARAVALGEPLLPIEPRAPAATPVVDVDERLAEGRRRVVEGYERAYLAELGRLCGGNVSEMARRAGVDRMTISRMLARLARRYPSK